MDKIIEERHRQRLAVDNKRFREGANLAKMPTESRSSYYFDEDTFKKAFDLVLQRLTKMK